MGFDYPSGRVISSTQDSESEERIVTPFHLTTHEGANPDDFILVLTPAELDTLRTSLRNESARLKTQGFTGLQTYVDNLRDKISNMMIDQTQARLDNKASV